MAQEEASPPPLFQGHMFHNSNAVFIWCQRVVPLFITLGRNVTREIASYLIESELLPGVFGQRLYIVNVVSKEHKSVSIPAYDRILFIPVNISHCVFISTLHWKLHVFLVNYTSVTLQNLTSCSIRPKESFAGCHLSNAFYLFIKETKELKLWKYSFDRRIWSESSTASKHEKIYLAVPNAQFIYLLIGSKKCVTGYMRYSPDTEEFTPAVQMTPT